MEKFEWFQIIVIGSIIGTSCSSKVIRVESKPTSAQVFLNDKPIGKTPMDLKSTDFKQEFNKPYVDIKVVNAGFEPKTMLVATNSIQKINVELKPYDKKYFETKLMSDFQDSSNELIREVLQIQGLIVAQKMDEAEEKNKNFMKRYPNVAAAFVLQSSIEVAKNNIDQAMKNLKRAAQIDPADPVVVRAMESLKKRSRNE